MFSHKSFVASATLSLVCTFSATNPATAADADASATEACTSERAALIRHVGHPGKSMAVPRDSSKPGQCKTGARKQLVLASFLDAPGGQALVDGRIERASREIGDRVNSAHELTNLCVLHSLQRNWADARPACDSAVEVAARNRSEATRWEPAKIRQANAVATAAYSNRAVMNWLAGDSGAAYLDLAQARAIDPKAAFVAQNFEIAVRVPAQVQLPIDAYLIG